ncbi:unnamed protein product [Arabis nemorensis]|uniref:Pentacotripeptide-repeat region of PRORP domain-containing protein n=1 Tax=Arabis nemorensis TaxID=586526 RepID=A0A565C0S7_9BRAS|nr:unnamed protein product [Arabis nemorensis]
MLRRLNLVAKSLRHVNRGDLRTLISTALCNRTVCTVSEEHYESSNHVVVDESYVLAELSSLLPISSKTSTVAKDEVSSKNRVAIDSFLLPEEKLRGVFLQKLKGKSAIEKALSSLGIGLSFEIVSNVVDRGNLSGEAMVTFFNWAIRQPGVSKDVDSYYVILRALGRRKFFDCMMDVLRKMVCEGVDADLKCLTIAMDSFTKAHYVRRAVELLEDSKVFGVKCSTESFNALLRCLCERSHVTAANSVFNAKKGKILFDISTYNIMISGWSKLGEIEEMEKVLKEMVEGGFGPNCLTFSHLIEGLGRAGRVSDSVEIFDNIKEKGNVPDATVYNAMICNFMFARDFDESVRYYRRMLDEECEPDLDTYSKLVSGLIKGRKVADALEMFEEMLSRGIVPTTGLVTSFLKPLCSYGPPHAAMVIYQKARKAGCRISQSAYKLLLYRLSRFGKCGLLLNVWDEMQESGYPSDVDVYEYIVDGLCNIGHLDNAVLVMEEAIRKGFCPNRLVYSRLSNKLMASNKTEMAYKLFLKIKQARVKENARVFWRRNGKWQQKFRKGKEEMEKWEALQVRWVSLFRNASSIIQRLQAMQNHGSYGALRCVKGIEDAVVQQQMDQLDTLLLSMKKILEEFRGCVLALEKLHREGSQLLKMEQSKKRVEERIGVKPCIADCLEGLSLLYDMHQSEYHLKSSLFSALSCLILKPSSEDLNALQCLVIDQPNIPKDEVQHIFDIIFAEEMK